MSRSGQFVLDPTGLYSPSDEFCSVASERQWLETVGRTDQACWISGEWLCRWTREWLRYHNALDAVLEEKRFPRPRLQGYLKSVPIPITWNDKSVLAWVEKLGTYPSEDAVAYLLGELTEVGSSFWCEPPSIEHLARYLSLRLSEELNPFVSAWEEGLRGRSDDEWIRFYSCQDRQITLRSWIGLQNGPCPSCRFPLEIPATVIADFDSYWTSEITKTDAQIIDSIDVTRQSGVSRIASVAAVLLQVKSAWLTESRVNKLAPFLDSRILHKLKTLIPPKLPTLLSPDAEIGQALKWATTEYLPYRRWQAQCASSGPHRETAESSADTFVTWLLKAYPSLKLDPVADSVLNYSVAAEVMRRSAESPVLWVVVDGLGWLEHLELVRKLCSAQGFSLSVQPTPKLAILPTKTEFAKWSLYSQLLPSHSSWEPDAGRGFTASARSERFTDAPSRREALAVDLRNGSRRIYCWDTTKYDSLFHNDTDWSHLSGVAVPNMLSTIADEIEYFVSQHPTPPSVQVVICSDHGQLIGEQQQLDSLPPQFEYSGRLTFGTVQDPRFATLDADKFGLPRTISIVRGPGCVRPYQVSQSGDSLGMHGGLLPEEVVVGVSVLRLGVKRKPVNVHCRGNGKAQHRSVLHVEIVNPNDSSISDGYLYIPEIPELQGGAPIRINVGPFGQGAIDVVIEKWPELLPGSKGDLVKLTGGLRFQFGGLENAEAKISENSSIQITQMFRSGMDIDDFI